MLKHNGQSEPLRYKPPCSDCEVLGGGYVDPVDGSINGRIEEHDCQAGNRALRGLHEVHGRSDGQPAMQAHPVR